VGTDIDPVSIRWARNLISRNRTLHGKIECRQQPSPCQHFTGVIGETDCFHASMCNPPFHGSAEEAAAGTLRKIKNLGGHTKDGVTLNFGGKSTELWCEGGESGFVRRMIQQSVQHRQKFLWFTSLVSKRGSLPSILQALRAVRAVEVRTIPMAQGQKQSRIVAWTFLTLGERSEWPKRQRQYGGDHT
jgi:23S rRNA (adenine1618-N6)-methyltransferase